jgi:hypothetical protein
MPLWHEKQLILSRKADDFQVSKQANTRILVKLVNCITLISAGKGIKSNNGIWQHENNTFV